MEEIFVLVTDGIHMIDGVKGAHSYLVTGSHLFLVDTGLPGQEKRIFKYLDSIGIELPSIEGIVLTHYDVDHIGSAYAIQQKTNCPVFSHPLEIPYILGDKIRPGLKRWLPLITRPIYGKINTSLDIRPLTSEKTFEDWEIIHTPGHTPGHITLYRNGLAIVGDLFQGGDIRLAPGFFTWDSHQVRESAKKIIERPLRWILPGHGPATPASSHWLDNLQKLIDI
jgi:glyoxylase-like metal-dependent hydrolase (beta-lactamase superfamily II)